MTAEDEEKQSEAGTPEEDKAAASASAEPAGETSEKAEAVADTPAAESTSETAEADEPEQSTAKADEPEQSTAKADEPEQSTAEADEPEQSTAKADEPEQSTAKADEPENDSRPKPPAGSIADLLAAALPDVTMTAYQGMTNVIVEIEPADVTQVMTAAKEQPSLDLDFLRYLCGVDHEDEGLDVVYHLMSLTKKHEVMIKTRLSQDDPNVASVAQIWRAADWHERETRDMFGITFEGHPHLVPLLMPEDMEDQFPLRKDSPLAEIEEWQGDYLPEEGVGGSKTR